jgi:hypothetical protein
VIDRGTENSIPGQWLPGRRFGEQARHDFEEILTKRPDFFYAAYLLGCWHRENGDTDSASQYFELAYAAAPVVLVMSFDLFKLPDSWEQNRPPQVTLVNNRTFAHYIDLTCHYGIDDCAIVRYPLLRADENGMVLIPAESEWLTWERTYYTGKRDATVIDLPADARPNQQFDTVWRFRGRSKVAMQQHVEMIPRPYDSNSMRTNPFFDPVWGTQQSLGIYEQIAAYCESQNEPSFLYDRKIMTPLSETNANFMLTESGTVRPIDGARLALIDTRDPRMLTWFLQQTGMARDALIKKTQAWYSEHNADAEIVLPKDTGVIITVVDCNHAAWLVKFAPVPNGYAVTTLRIGSFSDISIPRTRKTN